MQAFVSLLLLLLHLTPSLNVGESLLSSRSCEIFLSTLIFVSCRTAFYYFPVSVSSWTWALVYHDSNGSFLFSKRDESLQILSYFCFCIVKTDLTNAIKVKDNKPIEINWESNLFASLSWTHKMYLCIKKITKVFKKDCSFQIKIVLMNKEFKLRNWN